MSEKVLFIDRDGTLIKEPADEQVDSLEKLEFVPGVISALKSISLLGYEKVIASNQDGLGTDAFPYEDYIKPQKKMLKTFEGEGVTFDDILIDSHFPQDNHPCRKPGTGMFGKYLTSDYDMSSSYVIGDRLTDMMLARNLGAKGILLLSPFCSIEEVRKAGLEDSVAFASDSWGAISEYLRASSRRAVISRTTRETDIYINLDLDGKGKTEIDTGLKFFDHMLSQIPHHGGVSLTVRCKGDLEVDEHHTVEDVGIALGDAIGKALGDKVGIERYGFALPMDESCAKVLLDFGGRPDFQWSVPFTREYVGDVPTELFRHFFQSLCFAAKCNLQVEARGENNHHLIESVFKAFARTLRSAVRRDVFSNQLPSSKGVL